MSFIRAFLVLKISLKKYNKVRFEFRFYTQNITFEVMFGVWSSKSV